jgi:hypothetical protein
LVPGGNESVEGQNKLVNISLEEFSGFFKRHRMTLSLLTLILTAWEFKKPFLYKSK